jgi:hypothetical protein
MVQTAGMTACAGEIVLSRVSLKFKRFAVSRRPNLGLAVMIGTSLQALLRPLAVPFTLGSW